jgi:uncharacterized SAM-binding protein YcdF (DUF218 family)
MMRLQTLMFRSQLALPAVNADDIVTAGERRTDKCTTKFTATTCYCYSHEAVCLCFGLVNGSAEKVSRKFTSTVSLDISEPVLGAYLDFDRVTDFLFLEDCEIKSDFTVVLGMTLWRRPLARAVFLANKLQAGMFIFSGGWNAELRRNEAELMAAEAEALGVPRTHFCCEPNSRNTLENFTNSLAMIRQTPSAEPLSINIVAIGFHTRRALLTAQAVFPPSTSFGIAGYPSVHYGNKDWFRTERGKSDVAAEVSKIQRYFPGAVPVDVVRQLQEATG